MRYFNELSFGDEIRGVVCPSCGGSLVWRYGKAFCYEDDYVVPMKEETVPAIALSDDDKRWLDTYSHELEPEL